MGNKWSDGNTSFLRAARAGHLDKVLEHLKSNIDINTSNANGLNALHLASKDGHVDVVAELLKRGAVVDAATKKGNTALHIASLAGQEEVVKLLVQHGASVNVQSQNGFTPLYMAAQENHDNVVKYLLANGANQSLATEDGFTPLAVAMQQGHDKVVTVLLENDTRGKVRLPALHIAAKKDDVKAAKLLLENEHNPDVTSKSGFTPLHIASHYGNEAIANLLIHKGADVNYAAKHNITPLHVAAKWGKTNMVALLLEHGANIESKTRDGLTPLHCAARSGHEQVVDMLLERGAPISCKTKNGLAPLHMAAQGDHVDAARILLYHRAPVDEVTVDYLTALHVAAHCGHVRVAKLLLDRQADANARALNGFTPLHIACKKNRIKVVELLLKHGASIGATTESGLTPLHVASFMGCMNIVIYLLQHDANPDVPTVRGETPLHLAARANQTDIIRILLRNGAQVDARAREQQTPLHIASRLGNVDIVMLLLQHGAKVDTTTKDMYTALHIAAKEGQDEVAAVLIENGASLNSTTKKGFTPLHLAAKYGNIKVANLLLQKEAPVDAQGKNGVTPLHVASHYDHQNVALLLLDKGASPHATAKNGHTPLHIAARKNQMDIANTLLEYGAKPNAESKAGFTPLHLSAQEGHSDMSSLLIEHEANTNHPARNGLTPLHLCAQEDRVPVAEILVKHAHVDASTKGGFTPLHIASHYGQTNMVKFLLASGADVGARTSLHYTPLHQAAQQGHTNIVNILLENSAHPNSVTMHGQTPLHIAQKLGYISVIETLKVVTETTTMTITTTVEEKYKVVAPEAMQETFMSDSEEEGGEDTVLGDHSYRYLTADEMKSLGDDSLPIDVTRDERIDSNKMVTSEEQQNALPPQAIEDGMSPQYITENYVEYTKKYIPDNVDIARHPINIGFLVSFLVDARGGAMRGCRHSGVRVIVPPRCAPSPTRITCRYVRPQRTPHPPPLMEGEALASRVLELGPVGAKFLGPVIIEVPHFAALRGKEREIVILRSDNGETWREHTIDASDDILNEVLNDSFEAEGKSSFNIINPSLNYPPLARFFLVSFLVDARGGAMRGCRHSGVRVIVPPRCAPSPTRITCRYVRPQRTPHPPPLMEGEALASRVLELGPVGAKFLGPVIIEVPHFAALRGKEREIVILRSDNGETWREHTIDASDDILNEVLNDSFEAEDLSQLEDVSSGRITRVVTHDFPQYFAIVTRIRQEVHAIGPEGGMVSSTVVPQVQAVFPQGALTKKIKVGLQAQPIDPELTAKLLGHGVAVSPVVTVEPRRRKFHKAITLSMPAPRAHSQGMINQYSGNAPTLRLLCSITGGTTRAQWEDVTGSTPLTFVNDCVSFTTTVSARFWLMDCRNIGDATKMATELYKEAIHVPFMAKFVVFAKRIDPLEARLRVFCMTDDKEDKTLEHQEHFTEVAKSRDVEVLEGKPQYIEFAGNLVPITKSGEPLQFSFRAFRENRLPFSVRVKDQHAEAVGRCLFMREPKVAKGEPPQQPICILNIVLPDDIVTETVALTDNEILKRHMFLKDNFEYYRPDPRLADMSNLLGEDWVPLATQLGLTPSEINVIKSEYPDSVAKQAQSMLRMWISQSGNKAQGDALENALMRIGREDIIPQCLNVDDVERIPIQRYHKDIDIVLETPPVKQKETYESKYSAEEKAVDEPSDEEDFNKSVSERRQQIEKRLTERNIPASAQRQEIVEEITSIKRQSIVEDKLAEAEVKHKPETTKTTTIIKTVTTDATDSKKTVAETVETTKTTTTSDYQPTEVTVTKQFMEEEQPDRKTTVRTIITETRTTEHIPSNEIPLQTDIKTDRRDSDLLEGVTQRLETTKKTVPRISAMDADPNSPKLSKTPPPSPADFIYKEQAAVIQGRTLSHTVITIAA
ncbi:ZU5 domain [Popillia japonica]|uniref:ZU5 domain n=1 Tax=Popillia japonica TaxID=7064 RepID=A0AAW1N9M8_POPJA